MGRAIFSLFLCLSFHSSSFAMTGDDPVLGSFYGGWVSIGEPQTYCPSFVSLSRVDSGTIVMDLGMRLTSSYAFHLSEPIYDYVGGYFKKTVGQFDYSNNSIVVETFVKKHRIYSYHSVEVLKLLRKDRVFMEITVSQTGKEPHLVCLYHRAD